jgi:hypothetical protein
MVQDEVKINKRNKNKEEANKRRKGSRRTWFIVKKQEQP